MRYIRYIGVAVLSFTANMASPQAIDNSLSFKHINDDKYVRLNYENDYFAAADFYYTQGMSVEVVSPQMRRFPLCRLLVLPARYPKRYGIALEHNGYTPTNIALPELPKGDRPYAACAFFKTSAVAIDSVRHQRFSASLSTGVIGPAAGGSEMQTEIHKLLPNNTVPQGWHNQVQNDVIINYQFGYEKQLVRYRDNFSLDADLMARAGTFSDKVAAGVTLMGGRFSSPFRAGSKTKRLFSFYIYEHADVSAVAYDATMEGGIFNRSSIYVINPRDLTRVVLHNRFGAVISYKRIYVEYFQTYLSNEFQTGRYHVWGGLQIAFGI